ncbi:hypothetical protein D9V41_15630 [Aeromicrobium phragmitis]|uniref:NAD(P)/FAD-dependent oxidoreductase n=1 Tax=Aeromicrobium phragmitis TaxID=2478914 RepID=A0A3L8PJ24_9ACTN|nr:FAD-dependent oxidoreductase [Aeromicrobium phragmitis]RLV54558.1 hypothetical protein D9V41_15630 [Aeromicrobium phragmitis]
MTQTAQASTERRPDHVLVVGASLAGIAVVEELRASGFEGDVTVVDADPDLPYDRPPLSKQFLVGAMGEERLLLKPESWYQSNDVRLDRGVRAVALRALPGGDIAVELDSGRVIHADDVVIATGGRARRMRIAGELAAGVGTLRSVADARALRERLSARTGELLVAGAGFIGLEVASAAVTFGWRVTVVDRAAAPLARVLPSEVVSLCLAQVPAGQVDIVCDSDLRRLDERGGRLVAELADGSIRTFDEAVAGIGMTPNVEWLEDSSIEIGDGLTCDGQGRTSLAHVWAAGDVACWPNTSTGLRVRTEQWQAAREQGRIVAQAMLGSDGVWSTPPYFWTELFGRRVQVVGVCDATMSARTFTDERQRSLVLVGEASLRAVIAVNNPRWAAFGRRWLTEGITAEDAAQRARELTVPGAELKPAQ